MNNQSVRAVSIGRAVQPAESFADPAPQFNRIPQPPNAFEAFHRHALKGLGFIRAVQRPKSIGALAPAGCSLSCFFALFAILLSSTLNAQILNDAHNAPATAPAVQYLYPEQITIPAHKATKVELHFRIAPGLHINSHAPKEQFLIPTTFALPGDSGVKLEDAKYPAGADFVLPADPTTKLNVYTNEFIIDARLVAEPGDHLVQAKLRYQACDQTQCMPPRTITVPIDVVGK